MQCLALTTLPPVYSAALKKRAGVVAARDFAWILGVLLACTLGVINVMWYEFHQNKNSIADDEQATHDLLNEHNTNHNDD